jgi:hypothetical protein
MKLIAILALLCGSLALCPGQSGNPTSDAIRYTLLDGSYFIDDCLICGRPTIEQTLSGTFDLVLLLDAGTVRQYAVRNIDFTTGPGPHGKAHITGSGTYQIFAEFAVLQDMELATKIEDDFTNQVAYFTNDSRTVQRPFPLIQISLTQTNGRLIQTFSLQLNAAPLRELWFSIRKPLVGTNAFGQTNRIGAGDLVSSRGRVVKSNAELVAQLGVMPVVSDLGLDAVDVTRRGEILFSIPGDVFSETLGMIHHGDLLSNRGLIVKRNQQLLAAFGVPGSSPDAGLDAVQLLPDGQILFSTRTNVVLSTGTTLHHGDILSDTGQVFRTQAQLLANFRPAVTNQDFGLDAFRVLPSGEIWFSVEQGFSDSRLGQINSGDVLSDRGYRVFSNQQLVAGFGPLDPTVDYGLDAIYVVTDLTLPSPRAVFSGIHREGDRMRLNWDSEGSVFEVQRAANLSGPWESCSPILPDLSFEDAFAGTIGAQYFYRLRQW